MNKEELDQAVRRAMRHVASSFYLFFHYLNQPEALQKVVEFSPLVDEIIRGSQDSRGGILIVSVHMSNFDLVMQAAGRRGLKALAISVPEDTINNEAIEWQHTFRRKAGIEIVPASVSSFRAAIRRLKSGGIVLTGVDRPIPKPRCKPLFFGNPANVPIHYVHLALEADVPVVVICAIQRSDGLYHIQSSPEIRMQRYKDRTQETVFNAEQVLIQAAGFIRQEPDQWNVIQPIWPELLDKVP